MVFRHVYDEEKCYIPPCLWRGKHIDAMSMARKDAMSMAYECLCFEQGVEPLLSCVPFSHLHATEVPMEWMSCWFLLG